MWKLLIPFAVLILVMIAVRVVVELTRKHKPLFEYRRKGCVMTDAERECFHALVSEMGLDYYFFPQIHLDAIIQPNARGKDQFASFRHINQKSVDFVACDKKDLRPLFAIEVDDKTHNHPKRIERDIEVARILRDAAIPLIRIPNRGRFAPKELAATIQEEIRNLAERPLCLS